MRYNMIYERINLEEIFQNLPKTKKTAVAKVYIPEVYEEIGYNKVFPCVILCPGGAYVFRSQREDEPTVLKFLGAGMAVIKVEYSCGTEGGHYPDQLLQVCAAVALARRNKEQWHIDGDKIVVMGYSAGGHLAATVGNQWMLPVVSETLGTEREETKVNGMVLGYPVITAGEFTHEDSIKFLLGEERYQNPAERRKVSMELHVTRDTPPAFLWHTFADDLVPVENTLLMAEALRKEGVPFELHIYPQGPHGLAVCDETTADCKEHLNPYADYAAGWVTQCIRWIREVV
jgi:acetyl esterase/lipase